MEKLKQLKKWTIEQVMWAEKNLKGLSGAQKKASVVKKLDDLVKLPFYLEWCDDVIFSWLIDAVCEKLNLLTGHKFENLILSDTQENEIADSIEGVFENGK